MTSDRHRARRLTIAASLVISAAALIPVAAVAAPTSKSQDPNVSPASVSRGTTTAFSVSIKNESTSGNITAQGIRVYIDPTLIDGGVPLPTVSAPSPGVLSNPATTLAASPPYVEILNANVLRSKTYTFVLTARIPCDEGASSYTWKTDVRQSNDYSGTGNEIPATDVPVTQVSGGCSLAFVTQPANATPNSKITSIAFDESGSPVSVAIKNGAGGSVSWFAGTIDLTSTPASTITGGSVDVTSGQNASYTNLKIAEGATYTLTASTTVPGFSQATSGSFKVGYGTTKSCTAGDTFACSTGTIPGPTTGTSGAITVNDSDGLTADLSAEFFDGTINCSSTGYVEFGDNLFFDVTNVTAGATSGLTKTVTLTKPIPTDRPSTTGVDEWRYQLCFQSRDQFEAVPTFGNAQANFDNLLQALSNGDYTDAAEIVPQAQRVLGDTSLPEYRGLLPKCSLVASVVPCLTSVTFNIGGTVTFVATVPLGDPMGR